jgi:hypothetical protein
VSPGRLALTVAVAAIASVAMAQPAVRRATTIAALTTYPGFYHQLPVSVIGDVKGQGDRVTLAADETSIRLISNTPPDEGRHEVRGQLLDVGRMAQDDPRLIPFDLLDKIRAWHPDRWPRPGEELLLIVGSVGDAPAATNIDSPPLRALAMTPSRFAGQKVTITGQFRGRNLFGDLPEAPLANKWEYVLRASDAAIWVVGLEPKGKQFNFDPGKRIDTGRWVKVAGTVRTAKGLTWIEGTSIDVTPAPAEAVTEVAIPLPPPPPVEVRFSVPTAGETDVAATEHIRIQFTRDLDPASLKGNIKITYASGTAIEFSTTYAKENRVLEIKPLQSWERFQVVKVELLENIRGTDGGAMKPFVLNFTVGGS